ncbi:MAG TPA: L,D-transpeptidase [Anaerolineales bacterium]|nr:L,D-transpeptidase [Anaerolineales bacterium]
MSKGYVRLFLILGLLLAFGSLILAVIWFTPLGAFVFAAPAPTQDYSWSYVEIAKPAKMAAVILPVGGTATTDSTSIIEEDITTPTAVDTLIPLPTATETPGEMMMDILENTPTPVYVAPTKVPSVAEAPSYTYSGSKYILVDISEQHMYVYNGDTLVYSFVASTGMNNATRVGTFAVQSKIPNAYGSTWDIWMPNWLGIYWAGGLENGIHALPILSNGAILWEGYLGRPVSYGCVVLGTYESSLLYNWAEMGTTVEIQW